MRVHPAHFVLLALIWAACGESHPLNDSPARAREEQSAPASGDAVSSDEADAAVARAEPDRGAASRLDAQVGLPTASDAATASDAPRSSFDARAPLFHDVAVEPCDIA